MVVALHVQQLSFAYRRTPVLHDITLPALYAGEVTALVGPNGTGKSTLLRAIAGLHKTDATVTLGPDRPVPEQNTEQTNTGQATVRVRRRLTRLGLADHIVYVPQELPAASSITVFEAVLLTCQQGGAQLRPSQATLDRVAESLDQLNIADLAGSALSELSGGQRQLVSLAQALVRRPTVMLLDEPTSNLDLRNQLKLLELIREVATTQPAIVLLTIHDLGLAARFADRIAVLNAGHLHSCGPPEDTITSSMLREVYRVEASVHPSPDGTLAVSANRSLPHAQDPEPSAVAQGAGR
ncbi:MAG TPA: ABC transporter ATP-binding protein [Pseudonocardia sp.]|nr:ABC transporter ATP-binding protein [Pseudonocardia sp.]